MGKSEGNFQTIKNIEGSGAEWCISSMLYSADIPF